MEKDPAKSSNFDSFDSKVVYKLNIAEAANDAKKCDICEHIRLRNVPRKLREWCEKVGGYTFEMGVDVLRGYLNKKVNNIRWLVASD